MTGLMRVVWRGDAHDIAGPPINAGGRREYPRADDREGKRDGR